VKAKNNPHLIKQIPDHKSKKKKTETKINQTNQTNNHNRNPKHSLLSLMIEEEIKLTSKVVERTESSG
jgi:hypothetical protein